METSPRVTTLELFFDLVFVFAITQLAEVLARQLGEGGLGHLALGVAQVVLQFGVLWWMYAGYGWLTNTVAPTTTGIRLLLLVGMAGFLIIALAAPHAFHGGGVAWGIGYLIVVAVHGALYSTVNRTIVKVSAANVVAAVLVIVAGLVHGPAVYVLWTLALLIPIAMPYVIPPGGAFELSASHIVERHGLLVLIVFGESVVSIGIAASANPLTLKAGPAAVSGLALAAALWWTYFDRDDDRAEEALAAMDPATRVSKIMYGYFYAHLPIVIGVIATAAGLKRAIGHPWACLPAASALCLAAGVASYLVGDALFRRILVIGPPFPRLLAAVAALAVFPLGLWAAEAEVAALVGVVVVLLVLEARARVGSTPGHLGESTT